MDFMAWDHLRVPPRHCLLEMSRKRKSVLFVDYSVHMRVIDGVHSRISAVGYFTFFRTRPGTAPSGLLSAYRMIV